MDAYECISELCRGQSSVRQRAALLRDLRVMTLNFNYEEKERNCKDEVSDKCFGVDCSYSIFGDKVAVITDKMTEADANAVASKLNGCKTYRIL